jgi:hypothetical protein
LVENGISGTVCLGWPQTSILLISASQVAEITSVSHCPQLVAFKKKIFTLHCDGGTLDLGYLYPFDRQKNNFSASFFFCAGD